MTGHEKALLGYAVVAVLVAMGYLVWAWQTGAFS